MHVIYMFCQKFSLEHVVDDIFVLTERYFLQNKVLVFLT